MEENMDGKKKKILLFLRLKIKNPQKNIFFMLWLISWPSISRLCP